jgi:hypothetical protein
MSKWKPDDAIAVELKTLRTLKNKVRRNNAFGDDNRAAIDAQCSVLDERMSMDQVYDAWGDETADEFDQYVLDAAINACDWMSGELAVDEGKPSDSWVELVSA